MLFKKNKKAAVLDTVLDTVLPKKPQKSHKKRNLLIGIGSTVAAVIAAGVSSKKDDSQ